MGLDELVERFETRTRQHMTHSNKQGLRNDFSEIQHQPITSTQELYCLDDARAALRYKQFRQHKRGRNTEPYKSLADDLWQKTNKERLPSVDADTRFTGYSLLTDRKHVPYNRRFEDVVDFFSNSPDRYTDALICREHLRNDRYLNNKASKDTNFSHRLDEMKNEFDEYISSVRKYSRNSLPSQERLTKKFATSTALFVGGVLLPNIAMQAHMVYNWISSMGG